MQENYSSSQEKPIEQWNRQECEYYLKRYPKSLNSDAVRKQLERLSPTPQETKALQNLAKGTSSDQPAAQPLLSQNIRHQDVQRHEFNSKQEASHYYSLMNTGKMTYKPVAKQEHVFLKVIKGLGLAGCVGLGIAAIVTSITTQYKLTAASLAPLLYCIKLLVDWKID